MNRILAVLALVILGACGTSELDVPETATIQVRRAGQDETGDIWLYVLSLDRKGFLHLSDSGEELGFHAVDADFDLLTARVTAEGERLYFLVGGLDEPRIYVADRP